MNIYEQSSTLSCQHMTALAKKEREYNFYTFSRHITTPTVPISSCGIVDEQKLQQGIKIGKKNCVFKQPDYDKGLWEKQFKTILNEDLGNSFDIQTKKINTSHVSHRKAFE